MGRVTDLFDDCLRVRLQRTRDDDEADEREIFLDVLATQLTHLNTSAQSTSSSSSSWAAPPGGVGGYDVTPTFAACTPEGYNTIYIVHLRGTTAAAPQKVTQFTFNFSILLPKSKK